MDVVTIKIFFSFFNLQQEVLEVLVLLLFL